MPPILWLVSGSAFTCCRDASTSTATRWDSSPAMPRRRRWRAGAVEDARHRRLARRGSALVHPRRGAGGARGAAGRGRAGGGRRHRHDDGQSARPDGHLLPAAKSAAEDRRHRARFPFRRLRPAESHPPPRRRPASATSCSSPLATGARSPRRTVIAALGDDVALALLPAVLYRSGQLLDIPRLAAAARARGIPLGFDCAHSIGAVPHRFDEWGVDWAFWCSYKYLNAGPGATGGLYVNRRHWGTAPGTGWLVGLRQVASVRHGPRLAGRRRGRRLADLNAAAARHRAAARVAASLPRGGHRRHCAPSRWPRRLSGAAAGGDRAHRATVRVRHRHPTPAGAARRPPRRRARGRARASRGR